MPLTSKGPEISQLSNERVCPLVSVIKVPVELIEQSPLKSIIEDFAVFIFIGVAEGSIEASTLKPVKSIVE